MADELDKEFNLLNAAIKERDSQAWQQWTNEFDAWMRGDRAGRCPFKTTEVMKRTSLWRQSAVTCLFNMIGLSPKDIKNYVEQEAIRAKDSRRVHPGSSRNVDNASDTNNLTDERDTEDNGAVESPHGFIIQALRLEALQ
jgi:hypothetical protein